MPFKPPRLLIIDDDQGIRNSLSRILRSQGFEVELAGDGESAITIAERFLPDCLLVDIRLPGIDGIATFEAIRQHLPNVPAVFMTAYAASDQARAAEESGAISVLAKPLDLEALNELTETCQKTPPVLIVDDDRSLLLSLARALRSSGIHVETAASVRQAQQCIRQRPDRVVIADIFLNDGFGYDLLSAMSPRFDVTSTTVDHTSARDPLDIRIPSSAPLDDKNQPYSMVLITGKLASLQHLQSQHLQDCRLNCLNKPVDVEQLISRIKTLLPSKSPELRSS